MITDRSFCHLSEIQNDLKTKASTYRYVKLKFVYKIKDKLYKRGGDGATPEFIT